jgi:hypothetical protein
LQNEDGKMQIEYWAADTAGQFEDFNLQFSICNFAVGTKRHFAASKAACVSSAKRSRQAAASTCGPAPDERSTAPGGDRLWLLTFVPDQVRRPPLRGPLIGGRSRLDTYSLYAAEGPASKGGKTEKSPWLGGHLSPFFISLRWRIAARHWKSPFGVPRFIAAFDSATIANVVGHRGKRR